MSEPTTSAEVMRSCLRHWRYHQDLVIPNCCLPGWEADLLIIKPSSWAEEVEIKISAADFRREWKTKAEKHEAMATGRRVLVGRRYPTGQLVRWGASELYDPADETLFSEVHPLYGEQLFVRRPGLIRRFWFAMPRDLAERMLPEVPEHYGVLGVGHCNEVLRKAAVLVPARKLTDGERIKALQSTYFRFWRQALREPELLALPSSSLGEVAA